MPKSDKFNFRFLVALASVLFCIVAVVAVLLMKQLPKALVSISGLILSAGLLGYFLCRIQFYKEEEKFAHSAKEVVFDAAALLKRMMGNREMAQKVAQAFSKDAGKQIEAIERFIDAGDGKSARRQIHTLKGASANICAEGLRELAASLENEGNVNDIESLRPALSQLQTQLARFKEALEVSPLFSENEP